MTDRQIVILQLVVVIVCFVVAGLVIAAVIGVLA